MLLGPAVYSPVDNAYHQKLVRSYTEPSASFPTRQTPRFLSIIATPGDQQEKCRAGERMGDSTEVAVLRWDLVKKYLGSPAGVIKGGTGF